MSYKKTLEAILSTDNTTPKNIDTLVPVRIEDEMQRSYLDYAMSVIVSRALPDVRDGLKPVHRRILYAMHEMNNYHDRPYKKSAKIVGDVVGNYHPHGDSAIYGALVRMAQDFSLRDPLVDGQGNFGSLDGDSPAQMRYTEVRLAKIANFMLKDIELNTVDFQDNYDGSEEEPTVLPATFPQILVNGASGIAVGMATNIPTHNLREICSACIAYINNPKIEMSELLEIVPGPDFPTGGIITNAARARMALTTGRSVVGLRSKTHFEVLGGRDAIVATEIPYQVNKAEMLKKIEMLARNKDIEGISEIRDESNKLGVRVVIELKKGADKDVILNQLFKFSQLQSSVAVNMLALDQGKPKMMNLYDIISAFIKFREDVIYRRISHLLNKARVRAHVLIGLYVAVLNIEEVIREIKSSPNSKEAQVRLINRMWAASDVMPFLKLLDDHRNVVEDEECKLTEEQAKAILEMKLSRLTALESNKIGDNLKALAAEIAEYIEILASRSRILEIIKEELTEIKEKHGSDRLTDIQQIEDDIDMESLIQQEDMIVTLSFNGYIKRVPLVTYRAQRRGGKGRNAMNTREDDFTSQIISTNTHDTLLFFSTKGKVYKTKVYRLPLGAPNAKGRALVNLLPLEQDEKIQNIVKVNHDDFKDADASIIFATEKGKVRRNSVTDFANIQSNGKIAIRLDEDDALAGVGLSHHLDHVFIASSAGKAIRFPVEKLRIFKSRTSDGVRAIRLQGKDKVVSMSIINGVEIPMDERDVFLRIPYEERRSIAALSEDEAVTVESSLSEEKIRKYAKNEEFLFTITENGFGKRTSAYEYRTSGRGGQGITNINTSKRNGYVVSSFTALDHDDIILITDGGTLLRTNVDAVRISGRNTMGVKIISTHEKEKVMSVAKIDEQDIESEEVSDSEEGSQALNENQEQISDEDQGENNE